MSNYIYNLGQLFSQIALDYYSNPALRFLDKTIVSYSEIEKLSNKIANYLSENGVKQGDVVAIFNEKSIVSYSAMVACLKIGAIYTNLDYNSPVERMKKMITLCNPVMFFSPEKYVPFLEDCKYNSAKIVQYTASNF